MPAICAATHGLESAVLYRRPNIAAIDDWLRKTRAANMGEMISTGLDAPVKLADALERGAHVGMLVDQYYVRGVRGDVLRPAHHGQSAVGAARATFRLPDPRHAHDPPAGHRFRAELTEEIKPARDADGKIDIAGTTQIIMTVIEGWIREHPEQWLWLHRRWRPEDAKRP